ncbi:MAG: alpha/beta fold hydrolase, partial [Bacteroidota bacterium]
MSLFLKIIKWLSLILLFIIIAAIGYLRFGRVLDSMIYRADYKDTKMETTFDHTEMYLDLSDGTKIHAALFKPNDSLAVKATIIHHAGNGMSINDSQKNFYRPLIEEGYQIFTYERRGYGQSTGTADNSQTLRKDANEIFDQAIAIEKIKDSKIIIWGTSIGGIFATANAAARNEAISGLIIESAFSSFPAVAKFYASDVGLENFKFIIPLIVNNDFPTNREIKKIDKPVVIIHSIED